MGWLGFDVEIRYDLVVRREKEQKEHFRAGDLACNIQFILLRTIEKKRDISVVGIITFVPFSFRPYLPSEAWKIESVRGVREKSP